MKQGVVIRGRLNLNNWHTSQLKIGSIDWCFEASRGLINSLQDIGTIAKCFGYNVGTVPLAFQLGGVRVLDLSQMSVYSVAFLKGRTDVIFDLKILTVLDPVLSLLTILREHFVESIDSFLQSLGC